MITIEQMRAARAMLNLSQKQLAEKSGIATATINNIERGAQSDPRVSTMRALRNALEVSGVHFEEDAAKGFGVFLKPMAVDSSGTRTILIVDDDKNDRDLFKAWLHSVPDRNYKVLEAEDAKQGLEMFLENRPHCLVLDFLMYGTDGFQLLTALKNEHVLMPPIIFATAIESDELKGKVEAEDVYMYVNKQNLDEASFCEAVDNALSVSVI